MAQKYTILKVLIQNSSKPRTSSNGFTLIELIVGMMIMLIVGGLAMNALVDASNSFNKDKKSIEAGQNLSAVLEIIGNDVKQAGEQINEDKFPVIVIEKNRDADAMPESSKITIRRALVDPLTLCEPIDSTSTATKSSILVTSDSLAETNCKVGTIKDAIEKTTLPSVVIKRPTALRKARNKRCELDNANSDYTVANTDFCLTAKPDPDRERVPAAMSDGLGHIRTFMYENDTEVSATQYTINITGLTSDVTNTYAVGKPIYLMEERVYKLNSDGNLKLAVNGDPAETLIEGLKKFKVSARVYGNKENKESDIISPGSGATAILPLNRRCAADVAYYICNFNAIRPDDPVGTAIPLDDWKTLQGVKVEVQAKYDSTGRTTEAATEAADSDVVKNEKKKLTVAAEFFPRNVLSK